MRLLHTSDWHLGRTLHGVNLQAAQASVLGRLCDLVREPPDGVPVDAVVIAGDVYDRGVPPVESVQLFEQTLARLAEATTVIVTSGNHDSAIRLGYGAALFTERVKVLTDLAGVGRPVRLTGSDGVAVAVYGVPWLDPDHARHALATDAAEPLARSHQAVLGRAVEHCRADAAELAAAEPGLRTVLVAHAFVAGAEPSDSERSIMVGGVDRVASSTFDGFDYVALGHLHGPQTAPGSTAAVHYSGSPLRYSFSEQNQAKVALLVDLPASGPPVVTPVDIEQPRGMSTVRGRLESLLTDAQHAEAEQHWVRVFVTDRERPERMLDRLRSRFPHVLQVFHEPEGALTVTAKGTTVLSERNPRELGADFIAHVTRVPASGPEIEVFAAAYEQALHAEQAAEVGR